MNRLLIIVLAALGLQAGCATPEPNQYYRLEAVALPTHQPSGPHIGLRPVEIPQYLSRNAMVWRTDEHTLFIDHHQRWAEPLVDDLQRVLALNLAASIPTDQLQRHPWQFNERPEWVISVDLLDLVASPDGTSLVAEVTLGNDEGIVWKGLNQWHRPGSPISDGAQLAAHVSGLIADLAEHIAQQIAAQ